MSEEEKKAVERMKQVLAKNVHTFINELEIVLNLVEKLQKENEELNKYTIHLTDEQYKTVIDLAQNDINQQWIQKVKDKIEKLNDESHAEELEDIMIGGNYTITELVQYVLQELIEESEEK